MSINSKSHQRTGEQAWSKIGKVNAELFTLTYGAMVMQLIQDFEDVNAVNKQLETMGYNIGVRLIDDFLAKSNVSMPGGCADLKETADIIAKVGFKMFLGVTADVTSWNSDSTAFSLLLHDNPLIVSLECDSRVQSCNPKCIPSRLKFTEAAIGWSFHRTSWQIEKHLDEPRNMIMLVREESWFERVLDTAQHEISSTAEFVELPPQYSGLLYSNLLCGVIRGALEMVQMKVVCRCIRDVLRGDDMNEIRVELKEMMEDVMDEDYKEG